MTSSIRQWTLDAHDIDLLASFWSQVLGYTIEADDNGLGTCHLLPPPVAPRGTPTLWIQHAGEPKTTKNRAHLDLHLDHGDVDVEVERLVALGATHADVGQSPTDPFVVLRDPEGNEFCLLR